MCGALADRKNLFLISKVWNDKIYEGEAAIRNQVDQTLMDLGVDYIDLYLVHWPVPGKHVIAYQVLEALYKEGKLKSIGLSNYTIEDYEDLKPHISIPPVVNQFEINPFLNREITISYFQREHIALQSYRALRQGKGYDNPIVSDIAKKHNKTSSQVLGRWCIQQNIIVLAKSEKQLRMAENLDIFDFTLTGEDMMLLHTLTTETTLAVFKDLYEKCIIRDTPLQGGEKLQRTFTVL